MIWSIGLGIKRKKLKLKLKGEKSQNLEEKENWNLKGLAKI